MSVLVSFACLRAEIMFKTKFLLDYVGFLS
jgi:hypothetical protein